MVYVFLIYGLAFLLFGLALAIYPTSWSDSPGGRFLWLLAAFGVLHGLNEWVDLLLLVGAGGGEVLQQIRPLVLVASFLGLLAFGVCARGSRVLCWLPALALLLWCGAALSFGWGTAGSDGFARYLFGLPGAVLAASVFWTEARRLPEDERLNVRRMRVIAGTLLVYGFLAGVVVAPAAYFPASVLNTESFRELFGFPVQLLRTLCAVVLAHQTLAILRAYRMETERQLRDHRENLEHRIKERTIELMASLEEVRVLTGLLPICAWCKKVRDDDGYWSEVEVFVSTHSEADFSHSICPPCEKKLMDESARDRDTEGDSRED